MKVVLGILLLANTALLLWSLGQREFAQDEHSPAAEFHPELMEISTADNSVEMAKVTIHDNGKVVTSQAADDTNDAAADDRQISSEPDAGSSEMADGLSDSEKKRLAVSKQTAALELKKLSEMENDQCLQFGPYKTVLDRGRAGRQLQDMKISFSETEDPEGRVMGYRVYQGPFEDSTAVSRAKRRLEKQGVTDLYLMNEGPGKRFISLGFFSNANSARAFMKNFNAKEVKSKQRKEYETYYWINVSDRQAIEKLNGISAIPLPQGITKTIKDCAG